MAVGFTPKYVQDFPLDDLSPEEFLVITLESAKKLTWDIAYISQSGIIAYTNNGMFKFNAEVKITIEDGKAILKSTATGNEMIDFGKNKRTIANFIATLNELKLSLTKDEIAAKYEELAPLFISEEEDVLKLPPPTTTEQIGSVLAIFKPTKGYFVTPILVNINILVFIIMAISGVSIMLPDNESLLRWGANFRPVTLEGEWWRLITNCFLHIGIIHLLMNMYALVYIGLLLEPHLGKLRFITAYMLTGITASIASLWWHDLTISAGASGAIFGMYGVFLALLSTSLIEKTARRALLASIGIFVVYNLVYGMKGGIDNAAHIGGLLGGLLVGYSFIPSLKRPEAGGLKLATVGLLSLLILACSFAVYKKIPNDIGAYEANMKKFDSTQTLAMEVFSLPDTTSGKVVVSELRDRGIPSWQKNLDLLNETDKLNLPSELKARNAKLKRYCELRIKSYELLAKSIDEDSHEYDKEIADSKEAIDALLKELGG